MKKLFYVLIALFCVLVLTSCKDEEKFTIAMITDIGDIDDKSFNQGTWEGIKQYAEEYGISHKYYKPTSKDTDSYIAAIDLAVANGAKIVITPGFLFEEAVALSQIEHKGVKFVLIDGNPENAFALDDDATNDGTLESNTYSIIFAEEQVGYLAGYAAVKDGHTMLGYMGGMSVPAVVRYGQGFIFGANDAAKEAGITVDIQYHYTGDFEANAKNQATSATMYSEGATIIFAAGGSVGNSVMTAAELSANNGLVIGVDVDQSGESETVVTSATKGIGISAYRALESFFGGDWDEEVGGQAAVLDASTDGVGLVMGANSRFAEFTQAQYDALFAELVAGSVVIPFDLAKAEKEDELVAANVNLVVIGGTAE